MLSCIIIKAELIRSHLSLLKKLKVSPLFPFNSNDKYFNQVFLMLIYTTQSLHDEKPCPNQIMNYTAQPGRPLACLSLFSTFTQPYQKTWKCWNFQNQMHSFCQKQESNFNCMYVAVCRCAKLNLLLIQQSTLNFPVFSFFSKLRKSLLNLIWGEQSSDSSFSPLLTSLVNYSCSSNEGSMYCLASSFP